MTNTDNKALADRLLARAMLEQAAPDTGHNAADRERRKLIRDLREAAAALTSPQADKALWKIEPEGDTCLVEHPRWGRHVFHTPLTAAQQEEANEEFISEESKHGQG